MSLDIRLVHHIEAQLVAQGDECGLRGIMGGADGIDVQLFHHQKLFAHLLQSQHIAVALMGVMMVDAFQLHADAVDQQLSLFTDALIPQAYPDGNEFPCLLHHYRVQIRLLRVPQHRVLQVSLLPPGIEHLVSSIIINPFRVKSDIQIEHMPLGSAQEIHVPEDAIVPEKVLILQVT